MSYKHEVFISYKWGGPHKEWVDKIFYPILSDIMDDELPTKPSIFKDTENIVFGAKLDASIKSAIAESKCMVCIVSLPYFAKSVWCPTEFSAMLYREEKTMVRAQGNKVGFIFPILFVDPEQAKVENKSAIYQYPTLRNLIFNITPLELDIKYRQTNTAFREGKEYGELVIILQKWFVKSIKPAINRLEPTWQQEWDSDEFLVDPYEDFKRDYPIDPNPPILPSI
jgi:hypothetical protein